MGVYTVIGLWQGDEMIVAGVIEGEHEAVDSDPGDYRFNGRFATSVEADGPETAEHQAKVEMGAYIDDDDPEGEETAAGLSWAEAAELRELSAAFEAAGGRGVELAERIDQLTAKNEGRVWPDDDNSEKVGE